MRKNIFICLAILLIVLDVQCTGVLSSGHGSEKTEVQEIELLRINYLDIAPSNVAHPGDTIFIRMGVENIGQDDVVLFIDTDASACDRGDLLLYSICEPLYTVKVFRVLSATSGMTTAMVDVNYDGENESVCALKLKPDEAAVFSWEISAPTEDELFGMIHECTFKFRVTYKSLARTIAYVYFASPEEIAQRIYTREEMSMAGNNIATFGPVVAMVTAENQPYPAGSSFTLPVHLENRGKGIADVLDLQIKYPRDFSVTEERCELFEKKEENKLALRSTDLTKKMLQIYGGKSTHFHCEFKVPSVSILTPYRFEVTATYLYSIFEEKKIKVVPYGKE